MPDDPTKKHPHDGKRVSKQPHEFAGWVAHFNTTPQGLLDAIAVVGDSVEALEKYFGIT